MDVADMTYPHYLRHRLYSVMRWRGIPDHILATQVELQCARSLDIEFPGTEQPRVSAKAAQFAVEAAISQAANILANEDLSVTRVG